MKKAIFSIFILAALAIPSCIEKPVYPSEPVIQYEAFYKYGSKPSDPDSVELVVSFTDNEGDIGLEQSDTIPEFFKNGNIWLEYYYDSAGNWAAFDTSFGAGTPFDTFRFAYRVPPVLPAGDPSEPMKGLIYVMQKPFIKVHNKIKYVVYLYDRALHCSDTIHTPAITF